MHSLTTQHPSLSDDRDPLDAGKTAGGLDGACRSARYAASLRQTLARRSRRLIRADWLPLVALFALYLLGGAIAPAAAV